MLFICKAEGASLVTGGAGSSARAWAGAWAGRGVAEAREGTHRTQRQSGQDPPAAGAGSWAAPGARPDGGLRGAWLGRGPDLRPEGPLESRRRVVVSATAWLHALFRKFPPSSHGVPALLWGPGTPAPEPVAKFSQGAWWGELPEAPRQAAQGSGPLPARAPFHAMPGSLWG